MELHRQGFFTRWSEIIILLFMINSNININSYRYAKILLKYKLHKIIIFHLLHLYKSYPDEPGLPVLVLLVHVKLNKVHLQLQLPQAHQHRPTPGGPLVRGNILVKIINNNKR